MINYSFSKTISNENLNDYALYELWCYVDAMDDGNLEKLFPKKFLDNGKYNQQAINNVEKWEYKFKKEKFAKLDPKEFIDFLDIFIQKYEKLLKENNMVYCFIITCLRSMILSRPSKKYKEITKEYAEFGEVDFSDLEEKEMIKLVMKWKNKYIEKTKTNNYSNRDKINDILSKVTGVGFGYSQDTDFWTVEEVYKFIDKKEKFAKNEDKTK